MKRRLSRVLKITFIFLLLVAAPIKSEALDHLATGRTYDPKIKVEKRYPDTKGGFEIWLLHSRTGSEKLLYRTRRTADILFSQKMEWLVVNDAEGSGKTSCKLFKRKGEQDSIEYELARDLTVPAWAFFHEKTQRQTKGLHHQYVRARNWLHDPEAIVISLIGHGDPGQYRVRYWTCVYLVDEATFSTDLEAINKARVIEP